MVGPKVTQVKILIKRVILTPDLINGQIQYYCTVQYVQELLPILYNTVTFPVIQSNRKTTHELFELYHVNLINGNL